MTCRKRQCQARLRYLRIALAHQRVRENCGLVKRCDNGGHERRRSVTDGENDSRAPARTGTALGPQMAAARLGVATAADMLIACNNPRQTAKALKARFGVSRRTADRYVSSALRLMVEDATAEPIESKRARMVARLEGVAKTALAATNSEGEAVPDLRSATAALALLATIEGLTKPGG